MIIQKKIEFFKDATASATSGIVANQVSDVLDIQIFGDFTGAIIYIDGRAGTDEERPWVSLAGINLNNLSLVKNGFTQPGIYEFSVIGIRQIRARIGSISSGAVSVTGQLISSEEV